MRIILQLVMVLSGLLLAREFMTHSHEHLRLVLRWASIASENIATVREAPPSVAPAAVGPIAEVSAPSIAMVHEALAVVAPVAAAPIAEVRVQSIATVHDEPPALLAPTPVAKIAQVSAPSIALLRKSPTLVASMDGARIAEISPKSIATVHDRPAPLATMEVAPIAAFSLRSIGTVQERSALAAMLEVAQLAGEVAQSLTLVSERNEHLATSGQIVQVSAHSIATVRDERPRQLAPMAVAPIIGISTQSIAVVDEVPPLVAPATACEQIWDQMTHMSRDEWAEACRRVDELRLVIRN